MFVVELQVAGVLHQLGAIQLGAGKELIVILPKFSLFGGAAGAFSGELGLRVNLSQREVAECQPYAAIIFLKDLLERRLGHLAVRALEVRELDDGHPGARISPEPVGVERQFDRGRTQQDVDVGLVPQPLDIVLPYLLDSGLLQGLFKLRFDLREGTVQAVLLAEIKGVELGFRRLAHLGIDFLLEQLFSGDAFSSRFGFQELLVDQVFERPAHDVILLVAERPELRLG